MIIYIDISVFSEEGEACGNIFGDLELPIAPQIGDYISFAFTEKSNKVVLSADFDSILKVTDRLILANADNQKVQVSLSDITVPTRGCALKVMAYFESGFNLFSDEY